MNKTATQQNVWQKVKLGDFIDVKHGYAFKGKFITDKANNNILVTPGNFNIGGGFKSLKFKYFNGDIPYDYVLKESDIIITMTDLSKDGDSIGYSAKVPKSYTYEKYLHNQRIGLLQFHSKEVDRDFIYWLMRSKSYHGFIVGAASGTSIKHTSPTTIKEYEFFLPSLLEQKAIAEVLSSLDDKIDLLKRHNITLEGMAQTLFRNWFEGDLKDDWIKGKLEDFILLIESGSRPKGGIDPNLKIGIPSIGAENINGLAKYDYSKTKFITEAYFYKMKRGIVKDYDVLIYKDGAYVGKKAMFACGYPYKSCAINEHVFLLRCQDKFNAIFLYFLLQENDLAQLNSNSAQPGLNQEAMKSFKIITPPLNLINKFGNVVEPWIDRIFFNAKQIGVLTNLRDILLPLLMNGALKVKY